jgi:hypothetical protein
VWDRQIPLNIENGDFTLPALTPNPPANNAYTDSITDWTVGVPTEDGVCLTAGYAPALTSISSQVAYINDSITTTDPIATLNTSATYTINLYVHYGIDVELVDGSPTGTAITAPVLVTDAADAGAAIQHSVVFNPASLLGGSSGDMLYLRLLTAQGQDYATGVTGSSVPEPASLGLLGLGAASLLMRRRRRTIAG